MDSFHQKGDDHMKWNQVITIGRQFGSGGHEIGERVAEKLGIPCYDRELLDMAAKELGVDQYELEKVDEEALGQFLSEYRVPKDANSLTGYGLTLNDSLYVAQCMIIEKLAEKGPCVIVGRTAAEVLSENPRCINIFITASKEDRIHRISSRYGISAHEAAKAVRRVDLKRKYYYENYTDKEWGSPKAHPIIFNVSLLGQDRVVNMIQALYESEQDETEEES